MTLTFAQPFPSCFYSLGVAARKLHREPPKKENFLPQTEELKCQNKVDKMNRADLADSLRQVKKVSDEAEIILETQKAPRRRRSLEHFRTAHGILGAHGEEH